MVSTEVEEIRRRVVFFDPDVYEGRGVSLEQFREEVLTFLAEHLMKPTRRYADYTEGEWYHPDGRSYTEFFRSAARSARNGEVKARFFAEGVGWERAKEIAANGDPFVILSPPGDVYRTAGGAKSMTFVALPVRGEVGEKGARYAVYSIPSEELRVGEHVAAALAMVGRISERDPNALVATPYLATASLGALDSLACGLGYESFAVIGRHAEEVLAAEGDGFASERRGQMVEFFARAFDELQGSVWYGSEERAKRRRALSDVMHYYFSLEAGAEFVGREFREIEGEIKQYIWDEVFKGDGREENARGSRDYWGTSLAEIRERDLWRMSRILENERAHASFVATGCAMSIDAGEGGNSLLLSRAETGFWGNWEERFLPGGTAQREAEKLSEGDKTCYKCPVCKSSGIHPEGDVHLRGGYLVCSTKPDEHRIRYSDSD